MGEPPRIPRHAIRLAEQGGRQDMTFDLAPDQAGREAVAAALGIPAVRKLRLAGRLVPEGRADWRLEAELGATVVQDCVVTLEPVTTRIDEPVARRYLANLPAPEPGEAEVPEEDVEPVPPVLDLGEVMVEALALALPAFPRAPGAELGEFVIANPGVEPLTEERARPFAGLRDALKGGGSEG
jgi:uncharacterized metal-binding protein YceD (DUF177 family)